MAKRKGSRPVQGKKVVDPLFCGTITVEHQRQARKAADRMDRIASGISEGRGCGVWTDRKKKEKRRACRDWQADS
jgi:hypothetical protein